MTKRLTYLAAIATIVAAICACLGPMSNALSWASALATLPPRVCSLETDRQVEREWRAKMTADVEWLVRERGGEPHKLRRN